jgi:hypothetical protein
MRHSAGFLFFSGTVLFLSLPSALRAQTTGPLGLRLDFETGIHDQGGPASYFQVTRLLMDRKDEILDGLDLNLGGEALWLAGSNPLAAPWPENAKPNWVNLEWNAINDNGGFNDEVLRLSRLNLQESFDGFEATLGLQDFAWGSGRFFKPTDYFNPLGPLTLLREEPVGSEAADISQALFDDLGWEAAGRLTAGGAGEWVLRFPNRGIGLLATPSFVHLTDRQGLGLEGVVTFPIFQVHLEGVEWFLSSRRSALELDAGVSTRWAGNNLCLEWLKDGTGEALGGFSNSNPSADYFYFSLNRVLDKRWSLDPALVKSPEGGPFLFWPKVAFNFDAGWQLSLEGQVSAAFSEGPLALNPDRIFLALACEL